MQTLIYLSVTEAISFTYEHALLAFAKSQFPALIVYDADNHSDPTTIRYAVDLLHQATQCVLIIEALEAPTGSIRGLLEKVIEQQAQCRVLFNGANALIERMLSLLPKEQVQKNLSVEEQQKTIIEWLS